MDYDVKRLLLLLITVREAHAKKEEIELLEDGFEWVKDRGKVSLYRKLKM